MDGCKTGSETVTSNNNPSQPTVPVAVPDVLSQVPVSVSDTAKVEPSPTTVSTPTANESCVKSESQTSSPAAKCSPQVAKPAVPAQPSTVAGTPRPTSLPSAASEASVKNRSSRDEKSRKKDDKSVDHVLRALNSLHTTEEKLAAMCKKYADIFDEHRKLQLLHKQTEKRCSMLQREKEQLQTEHSKAILTRSRLENLCRELQRQNKAIKDESLLKIREEEEKRKEVSAKFQTTMNEITTLMQQNNDKNMKLRDDNIDMTTKLKNICEQYEIRQQQVERISKQMQLEQQLADAKLAKLKMEMAAEREMLLREKQQLLLEIQQYQQRCTEFQATEVNLRNQISMYNDKYDEFQKALARSNDVFGGFKGEMEKMSKKICKLEKETSSWKQRWERSHNALLEMAADKQKSEQELAVVSRQLVTLQGLCRTLQTERTTMLAKLKAFQAGGPEPPEKLVSSVEKCTKKCEALNQDMNHVMENNSNPVLDSYTKDILDSFKESVAAEINAAMAAETNAATNNASNNAVNNTCVTSPTTMPNPLPDVVGDTNQIVDNSPDVNNGACPRLENLSITPGAPENSIPTAVNTETVQESVSGTEVKETSTQPSVIVENSTPVVNGDAHIESSSSEPNTQSDTPKSPAKNSPKSTDSGKKVKEANKKKKK
ncbi:alpha-taxilin [Macrosteles quadrilineatus]|uniref:alpha-taxilin n=1 Tax=Macrosteles quadrilineatus TaxID=74068 RepID=UPI0023E17183|nr:alpha-taxilin [Macrosteles quadrilineatus]XP_054271948.1 alpha-taxilin [Macrosteles quadrilineatus]XP_054271949.1 alpha-taxilin [Macrosteles quadrilineatus]XP_054271950.1 alpha-taxilin [Macrosteles quadrilineatus]